jgi:RNA polymerase sigma-70 factor (ECF subfamily)
MNSSWTSPSLLARLGNAGDSGAWEQFVALYTPLVRRFAQRYGLQEADTQDVTQEVMVAVVKALQGPEQWQYDPKRGRFRSWLFTVVQNKLHDFFRRQRQPHGTGDSGVQHLLAQQPAPEEDLSAIWDEEYERFLWKLAASQVRERVREATWKAFWLAALEKRNPKEVAENLNLSVAAVYLAISRVRGMLKKQVQRLQKEHR